MAEEGFLQRWSRRKAEARAPQQEREAAAEAPAGDAAPLPAKPAPEQAATPVDAPARDDPDAAVDLAALPDIDSLTYESDFTVFMRKGVPAELRKRALQRLWRSNPTLANLDGLVEYGDDYTKIGKAKQVVRTAYQVGRGMLERLEPAPADDRPAAGSASGETAGPQPIAPVEAEPEAAAAGPQQAGAADQAGAAMADRRHDAARPAPAAGRSETATRRRPLPRRG